MPHIGNFPRIWYPKPLAIPPSAFVPNDDTQDWDTGQATLKNRAALTGQSFYAPVYLPQGVTVKKLTLYGYRDDALATLQLDLSRNDRENGLESMATVAADWTTGYSSKSDTSINFAVIDNINYNYALELILDPNDAVGNVAFTGAVIEWE